MEMFILIYLIGAAFTTTVLYGMSYKGKDPPVKTVAVCFFLWWLVLSILIAYGFVALGTLLRKKFITNRG